MERDFKRRTQHTTPTLQQRLQRRASKPDTSAQQAARAEQQAARQANFESFVQRFATTPEAKLASDVLTSHALTTEHQSAARALPAAGRVRLQRLLQSQYVTGSLSLGREALNPVQRASDQTVADLTGLPVQAATLPAPNLETRLQRHRDAKISAQSATLEPSAAQQHSNLERPAPQLAGNNLNLQVQRADDGQNQLSHISPNLSRNVQRSPAHSDAVTDHIAVAQTARVQRQRAVGTRAGELRGQMLSAQVQRLRAPDAPNLEASGKAYTLTGQADRINTDLPIMRAKHNHDPAYLDGDTKPVTDFARHVGLSLGRQYHVQRTKAGARPADLSNAISRVHDGQDRANLLSSTLMTFNPNDREAASVQRLVSERETELELQRQALETDLEPVTQRLAEREAEHPENLSAMIARAGGGEELPEKVKRQLQPQFNFSLDIVRIHRDGYADQLAKTVNAVAFTTGMGIFFRSGKYDPSSAGGRGLLVHELTHVGQQLEGLVSPGPENPGLEGIAQTAGAKEESKGVVGDGEARDSVESGGLSGEVRGQQAMGGVSALQRRLDNSDKPKRKRKSKPPVHRAKTTQETPSQEVTFRTDDTSHSISWRALYSFARRRRLPYELARRFATDNASNAEWKSTLKEVTSEDIADNVKKKSSTNYIFDSSEISALEQIIKNEDIQLEVRPRNPTDKETRNAYEKRQGGSGEAGGLQPSQGVAPSVPIPAPAPTPTPPENSVVSKFTALLRERAKIALANAREKVNQEREKQTSSSLRSREVKIRELIEKLIPLNERAEELILIIQNNEYYKPFLLKILEGFKIDLPTAKPGNENAKKAIDELLEVRQKQLPYLTDSCVCSLMIFPNRTRPPEAQQQPLQLPQHQRLAPKLQQRPHRP